MYLRRSSEKEVVILASRVDDCSCQQLSQKEQEFFETLYQQYKHLMYSAARQYTSAPDELDEIMQDAVERMLHKIEKLATLPE